MTLRYIYTVGLVVLVVSVLLIQPVFMRSAGAQVSVETPEKTAPWSQRCDVPESQDDKKPHCEIFQRLVIKNTRRRFAEFAIGYSDAANRRLRGIVILPLGTLLTSGAQMKVDDRPSVQFSIRYCDRAGCFARVALDEAFIDQMRRGKNIVLRFWSNDSKEIKVPLSLKGFTKALRDLS